jgi:trimeric autotransporter adhesin
MATSISNGESGLSVRTKLNDIWHSLDLNEYNKEILDTAVDIFVYDTSKDSDGGAWRKRTQGTSWYNETLNTSTRGSRKEFPAVAVIVAESNGKVTIYDGDDPDLPMWMIFPATSYTTWATIGTISSTSVSMLNGKLGVVTNDGGVLVDYLSDKATLLYSSTTYGLTSSDTVEGRNQASSFTSGVGQSIALVYWSMNDVAMTVLPNAPIDVATGLPVPTIAVATDGGVSVIKDDGSVVDFTQSVAGGPISIGEDGIVYVGRTTLSTCVIYGFNIPSADISTQDYYYADSQVPKIGGAVSGGVIQDVVRTGDASLSYAYNNHFGNISEVREELTRGMISKVTSDYNTGWQNGAIKLATLSDTDDTDVTGSELVTNGTFDSDTSGWTASALTTSVASGQATLTMTSTYGTFVQGITTVVGKTYTITCDIVSETVSGALYLGAGTTSGGSQLGLSTTSVGSNAFTFTATGTTTYVALYFNGASSQAAVIDNFTARLAEEDRSVNGNGLQVFGTVTKNPVATGADLVAYSGFSASNYLEQPYNSDLDFGTGDFCVMGWVKVNSSYSGTDYILSRGTNLGYAINVYSGLIEFIADAVGVTKSFPSTDNWFFIACGVRGGYRYISVNAQAETTSVITTSVDEANASLIFGVFSAAGAAPFDGSLALLRISATAPTAEQIAKIYNDEKVLFQENAQATLYGSSDAVTALAYDDSTELLHVGTSAGRSVFQGLRRVSNTTTAVETAISASNSLVVEE